MARDAATMVPGVRSARVLLPGLLALALVLPVQAGRAERAGRELPFAVDPSPSSYRSPDEGPLLIRGATVLDGVGGLREAADVRVEGGRITEIGSALPAAGAAVVEAAGRWLTPGIVDPHSHNGTYSMPQTEVDAEASDISETSGPNSAGTWVEHAVNVRDPAFARALASGVTTLQILPGSAPVFGGRSVVVKPLPAPRVRDIKFPGAPQGLKLACGDNPKGFFAERGGPTSRMGTVAFVRSEFLRAREYRDDWWAWASGRRRSPPARDLDLDTLAAVLEGDIAVHLHCYRSEDIAVMLDIAREFGFHIAAVHHATEAYQIPALMRRRQSCAVVWSDWWHYKIEAMDATRANAAIVDAAGACVALHSDGPLLGQRLNIEAAKAMAEGAAAGLDIPPERAIRWLTSNPAHTLGLGDRIGRIAEGFNADLVLWSGNPFSIYSRPERVWVDGALVAGTARDNAAPDFSLGRPAMEVPR